MTLKPKLSSLFYFPCGASRPFQLESVLKCTTPIQNTGAGTAHFKESIAKPLAGLHLQIAHWSKAVSRRIGGAAVASRWIFFFPFLSLRSPFALCIINIPALDPDTLHKFF